MPPSLSRNVLYSIDSKYFCAGIIVHTGTIVDAAPILKWCVGKEFDDFRRYCHKKKWSITNCNIHRAAEL
jgi:hypothetical protein